MTHARPPQVLAYVLVRIGNSEMNSATIVLANSTKFKPSDVILVMTLE